MHFLDTCICIEFLRGRLTSGYQLMRKGRPEDFRLPAIVVAELLYGAEHSANPTRETKIVETFVEAFTVVPFDAEAGRHYAKIRQELGSQGNLIGERDLMIAATALAHRATLVSRNMREFQRVPGLRLESWSEAEL